MLEDGEEFGVGNVEDVALAVAEGEEGVNKEDSEGVGIRDSIKVLLRGVVRFDNNGKESVDQDEVANGVEGPKEEIGKVPVAVRSTRLKKNAG